MFYISGLTFASCVHFQSTWNDSPVRGFTPPPGKVVLSLAGECEPRTLWGKVEMWGEGGWVDANARLHQLCCNQANSLSHKPKERTAANQRGFTKNTKGKRRQRNTQQEPIALARSQPGRRRGNLEQAFRVEVAGCSEHPTKWGLIVILDPDS